MALQKQHAQQAQQAQRGQQPTPMSPKQPKVFPIFAQPPAKKAAVAGGSSRPAAGPAPGLAAKPAQRRIVDLSEVRAGLGGRVGR